MLSIVPPANRVASLPPEEDYPFARTTLVVAFAACDDLSAVASDAPVTLCAVPEISSEDAYLLLPLRARDALLRAFAKGKVGAVAAWFADALVVHGELERVRAPRLWVGDTWSAQEILRAEAAARIDLATERDPVRAVNALPWVAGLAHGGLLDDVGAATLITRPQYVGVSRVGVSALGLGHDAVEPTFVWSERDDDGVHVRVAITAEDDDALSCLLAPVSLVGGA